MSNENNTPEKSDKPKPAPKLKEKRPRIDARENPKKRNYKGRVL
jgi:hypothetical protein